MNQQEQPTTISPEQAWEMMQQGATLLDVRDLPRFAESHAEGAFHLTNHSYGDFQRDVDFDEDVIVICYHGVSSMSVGSYLIAQGYDQVYSVAGGFEAWQKARLPVESNFA